MKKIIIALTIVILTQSFSWAGIQFGTQSLGQSSFVQHQLYALQRLHGLIDQKLIYTVHDPYDIMIKMSLSQPDPNTAYWLFKIAKIIKKVERNEQIAFVSILYHHSQRTNNTNREEIFHTILQRSIKKVSSDTEHNAETNTEQNTQHNSATPTAEAEPTQTNDTSDQTDSNQDTAEDTQTADQKSEENFTELNNLINGLLGL